MSFHKRLKLMRRAARVPRYHILPPLKEQTVGTHTFGVMALLHEVWPDAPVEAYQAALFHDAAEAITGDTPATAKWRHPSLEVALKEVEADVAIRYELPDLDEQYQFRDNAHSMPAKIRRVIKYCDIMELILFAMEEVDMGNILMMTVAENGINALVTRKLTDVTGQAHALFNAALGRFNSLKIIQSAYHADKSLYTNGMAFKDE